MFCTSACIRKGWYRGSSISGNGQSRSFRALGTILRFLEILDSSRCSKSRGSSVPAQTSSNRGIPARDLSIAIPLVIASDEGLLEFLALRQSAVLQWM